MKLCFLTVSSKPPPWLSELTAEYIKRLQHWVPTELRILPAVSLSRGGATHRKKSLESQSLEETLTDQDFVIACDEKGRDFSTLEFAKKIENIFSSSGKKRLVILIGGAYGLEESLKRRAHMTLNLSPMTTTHHMALAFVFEQVYRAMTIIKGVKYHNE